MHTSTFLLRRSLWVASALLLLALLSACGGGGSGATSSAPTTVSVNLPASAASASDTNVAVITVGAGPRNNVNIPYVSVTLCAPGSTSNCKTINNVLLDTGSTGLRIFSSILGAAPALALPAHTVGASSTISECAQFLTTLAWGPVKVADVSIGGKTAAWVPVHIMETSQPPASCGSNPRLAPPTSARTGSFEPLSANGILGVSQYVNDGQTYFNCASPTTTTPACRFFPAANQQVQNPVALFASDNNGVLVQMPAVPAAGATSVQGYLVFGVGTRSNNQLGNAHVVPLNTSGFFTTTYKNVQYTDSFIDSGSNGLFFDDPAIATSCTANGFYCPTNALSLSADIDLGGSSASVNFSIANSNTLLQGNLFAFNNLGGPLGGGMFDWGLPFFLGRSVYTVLEGATAGGNTGPFYAFTN